MTSSVDPTLEMAAIKARLLALGQPCHEGVPMDYKPPLDGWGRKSPYRDLESGSVIPTSLGRGIALAEQSQPYYWSFQIHHVAPTREQARALSTASDVSLIGWEPTTNAGMIRPLYFTMYDALDDNGEVLEWIASRFYEVALGQSPELS